jgi:hypothetical protein
LKGINDSVYRFKLINLKDHWENGYYLSIAEDYLQTTLAVLLKYEDGFDLKMVAKCLDFSELAAKARELGDKDLQEKVKHLQHYDKKELAGLQAHLNLLIHSELGQFKRKISGSIRSDEGRRCRDTFASLKKTTKKLKINFWEYLVCFFDY